MQTKSDKPAGYVVVVETPDMPLPHRYEIAGDADGSQYPIGASRAAAIAMARDHGRGEPCAVIQEIDRDNWRRWPLDMIDATFAVLKSKGVDPHDDGAIGDLDCDDDWAYRAADAVGYRIVWEQIPFIPPVTDYRDGRWLLCKPL